MPFVDKTVVLKFLFSKSLVWTSLGMVSVNLFCSFELSKLCFLVCLVDWFFWFCFVLEKIGHLNIILW